MQPFTLTIDGRGAPGEGTFAVRNPATGAVLADAPNCSPDQLAAALAAASRAFPAWSAAGATRRSLLRRCADVIHAHAEELARLLTQEQGKPLSRALWEIRLSADWFTTTAELSLPVEVLEDGAARIELHHQPLGVVAAITPWNYPIILAVAKIAPALLAGNTVIVKPSPYTPLTTLWIGELLRPILPPGVLNVISGGDELGALLTAQPAVRKISFTGSIEAGKKVAAAAAADLKRTTLELGGNDAAIVLPDVDLRHAAEQLFWGAFENSGQYCCAIKRLFVHHDIVRPLLAAMADLARSVTVGNGLEPDTQLGPLNNAAQFERITMLVEDARRAGASIVTGGAPLPGPGYFYPPTLLIDVPDDCAIVAEEQFGPALPILTYATVEEAVARANRTSYGLGGSVWSQDIAYAATVARQLECGTAWVNQHGVLLPHAPFGGAKWSGIGLEYGIWGLREFTQPQVINIARS